MSTKEIVIPLEFGPTQLFILLIFVILVYVAYTMYDPDNKFISAALATLGGAFVFLVYYGWNQDKSEEFVDYEWEPGLGAFDHEFRLANNEVLKGGHLNMNDQDHALSKQGNISWEYDAGPVTETTRDIAMDNPELDNTDVVRTYTEGGASRTYVPQEAASKDFFSVRDLTYPKHPGFVTGTGPSDVLYSEYQVPLSDRAINIDDKMARKQHHRAEMNKKAIDGAVRTGRNYFERFFANELAESGTYPWWEGDATDKESDFKYYE